MPFTKTYFLCPTSDFIHAPPRGPLSLGSIIRSTSAPQYPLNRACVLPVVDPLPPIVENDWRKTISKEKGLGMGVYAQFLQLAAGGLPLGSELDIEHSKQTSNTFAFDTMTTLVFEPSQDYLKEAIKAPAVQAWLREPRQKFALVTELFIITGLKLVKGAKIKYSAAHSTTVKGNIGIDMSALGTTFGPKGYWTSTNDDSTEFNRESEFVFAFCVKKLRFGRRLKLGDYHKGAFMAIAGESDNDDCIFVENVDGDDIKTAQAVFDKTENGNVYCVPP